MFNIAQHRFLGKVVLVFFRLFLPYKNPFKNQLVDLFTLYVWQLFRDQKRPKVEQTRSSPVKLAGKLCSLATKSQNQENFESHFLRPDKYGWFSSN